jgi:hypothetical protein
MPGRIKLAIAGLGAAVVGAALMTPAQAQMLSLNTAGAVNGYPVPTIFENGYCNQVQPFYPSSSTKNCYTYGKIYDVGGGHVGPKSVAVTTWGPAKLAFNAESPESFDEVLPSNPGAGLYSASGVAPGSHQGDFALNTQLEYGPTAYCGTLTAVAEKQFKASQGSNPYPPNPTLYPGPATWTEMQHSTNDWEETHVMWGACSYFAPGNTQGALTGSLQSYFGYAPGTRLSTMLRRDVEKALNMGALTIIVPTVDTVYEAMQLINHELYPPFGHRPYRPGIPAQLWCASAAATSNPFGANCSSAGPGGTNGYRATFNANFFGGNMIETVLGSQSAPHIGALFATFGLPNTVIGATSDLGNFSGFTNSTPTYLDYDLFIRNAYLAAHRNLINAGTPTTSFNGRAEIYTNAEVPVTTPDNIPMGGGVRFIYEFNDYQN